MNISDALLPLLTELPYRAVVPKVWGRELIIVNRDKYCAKFLIIEPGYQCSLHLHNVKQEDFYVLEGVVKLELGTLGHFVHAVPGTLQHIAVGRPHRFSSLTGAIILEVSSHHNDDDVVRLEESGKILCN